MKKVLFLLLLASSPLFSMTVHIDGDSLALLPECPNNDRPPAANDAERFSEISLPMWRLQRVPKYLARCSNLTLLNLENNNLDALSEIPPKLTELNLRDNFFKTFPRNIPQTLKKLLIGLNYLTELPSDLASLLPYLVQLNVARNEIVAIPPLPETLEYLGASENLINALPAEWPKKLSRLELSKNKLPTLGTAVTLMEGQGTVIFADENVHLPYGEQEKVTLWLAAENERRIAHARATPPSKSVVSLLDYLKK